ncbi:MAG: ABC transporter ATP-binding protein [Spirochaetales bacterium]|nr:ABC transporter ATP-binding protein [Spirochaetales bacterium]
MPDKRFQEDDHSATNKTRTILRLFSLLIPHWKLAVVFLALITVVSVQDSVFTYISMLILDTGVIAKSLQRVTELLTVYFSLSLLQAACVFGFILCAGFLGEKIQAGLRGNLFDHLQNLSFSYFDRTPLGWIMSRVTSDSRKIADLVTWGLLDLTWSVLNIVTTMVFMFIINWRLALIVITIIPVMILVAVYFQKKILSQYRIVRRTNSELTGSYNEAITGIRVIKAMGRENECLKEFESISGRMYGASYRAAWLSSLFLPIIQIIGSLALGAIIYFGGIQQMEGGMTLGGIQAFISYIWFMLWPIQQMARVWASMQNSLASAERIFNLLDMKPEIENTPGAVNPGSIRGDIVMDSIGFYYDKEKAILTDFNLTIRQGETVAIVGPTGAGKSTIINLICRFYEPTEGRILINGTDYRQFTLHGLQSRIGIVLQTPHLFSGSIRENIRYGKLDATDEEVEAAAKISKAHEFITKLENGYDEDVGEGGNLLSVGQKQLVSLARAVLGNPDIFIMDEATSSIDTLTESLIQEGLNALTSERTSIIIAHRLSTIRHADRILVLSKGKIIEDGDHEKLMSLKGRYYNLYTRQYQDEYSEIAS